MLSVIWFSHTDKHNKSHYTCLCECWNQKTVAMSSITRWLTKSCWCIQKSIVSKTITEYNKSLWRNTDWRSKNSLYGTYKWMLSRCYNVNAPEYLRYWQRWIKVHDNWLWDNWFLNFIKDLWDKQIWKSIDRINNNWHYEPTNVKWATPLEQAQNRNKKWYLNFI